MTQADISDVSDITESVLHRFFDNKVDGVRDATSGAPPPQFSAAPIGCELRCFQPVTPSDIVDMVQALPDKQCSSDPQPTWLLKTYVRVLAPFLCRLVCWSLNGEWLFAFEDEISLHHPDTQEGRHGHD